jgi:capsular exopolysaccharide synthesis family protein
MEPIRYVRAIRRRWLVIVAFVLLAVGAAWVTTASVAPTNAQAHAYSASALVDTQGSASSTSTQTQINPDLLVVYVTLRQNGEAVAKKIGYKGSPLDLLNRIHASADSTTGIIAVQATDPSAHQAEQLADAFASQLISFVEGLKNQEFQDQIKVLEGQLADARGSSGGSGSGSGTKGGTQAQSQTSSTEFQIQQELQTARQQLHTPVPLTLLQGASATPLLPSGLQAPSTRTGRVALGALAGLLAGIVLALVLERFDTKIRTRDTAEDRFGVPVLAEIPRLPRADRRLVTTAARPTSPAADAFRLIAAAVSRGINGEEDPSEGTDRGSIILVTSSGPSEGKTTVVANLAAVFAEVGRSVLILSCDLRRPQIHRLFGVDHAPGLTDALGSQNGRPLLEGRMVPTTVPNVSLVPSGTVNDVPAGLLGSDQMRRILAEARSKADVVLMDTAPILVASEVAPLVGDVDAVVVVAEAGKTTSDVAGRTTDLLKRLGAPVVGVVLNRAGEITIPRGYYRYYSIPRPTSASHENGSGEPAPTEGSPDVDTHVETEGETSAEALDR